MKTEKPARKRPSAASLEEMPPRDFRGAERGRYAKRIEAEGAKVRITMYVDLDVLTYFQRRAARPNAAGYQTQINEELRRVMEGDQTSTNNSTTALLADESFLREVAKRVKELATN